MQKKITLNSDGDIVIKGHHVSCFGSNICFQLIKPYWQYHPKDENMVFNSFLFFCKLRHTTVIDLYYNYYSGK